MAQEDSWPVDVGEESWPEDVGEEEWPDDDVPLPRSRVDTLSIAGVLVNEAMADGFYDAQPLQLSLGELVPRRLGLDDLVEHRTLRLRLSHRDVSPVIESDIFTIDTGMRCESLYDLARQSLHLDGFSDSLVLTQGIAWARRIIPTVGALVANASLTNEINGQLSTPPFKSAKTRVLLSDCCCFIIQSPTSGGQKTRNFEVKT